MKSHTDLPQSKKLSEILPLESADMYYPNKIGIKYQGALPIGCKYGNPLLSHEIAVWSLAALLDVLPYPILCKKSDNTWGVDLWVDNKFYCTYANSKIDACYEMIIKLKEMNLL